MQPLSRTLLAHYWEARADSPESAARFLHPGFLALQEAGLGMFFLKARSRRRAESTPFTPSLPALQELLARGVNRRDTDRQPIPELGFSIGLWSGGSDEASFSLSVHIGSTSPHARNCLLLELPAVGPYALHRQSAKLHALFSKLVEVLRPSQGIVCEPSAIRWEGAALSPSIPCLVRYPNAA